MKRVREKWEVRTNLTNSSKEDRYNQLLQYQKNEMPKPDLAGDDMRKLLRDCKAKREDSDRYKQLLEILQELLDPTNESSNVSGPSRTQSRQSTLNSDPFSDSSPSTDDYLFSPTPALQSEDAFPLDFGELEASAMPNIIDENARGGSAAIVPYIIAQPTQFNSKYQDAQLLFHLSRQYYHFTLQSQEHSSYIPNTLSEVTSLDAKYGSDFEPNNICWWNIKNAVYFAKNNSHELVEPELTEALKLLPQVCETTPFALLKDLFATLSPVATQRCPALRSQILRAFCETSAAKLTRYHMLSEICRILYNDGGDDHLSMMLLPFMLDVAKEILNAEHHEIRELSCTLISFYRRNKQFEDAKKLAQGLIETQIRLHGRNDPFTNQALSELVYVYNDQGQFEQALSIAEEIIQQAKVYCGDAFPDKRSVYHMEDIAEVCDKLGRTSQSINWLWQAYNGARRLWGGCSTTWHISDKLQAMHDKERSQLQVYTMISNAD